jgi:hypothetical protein
MTESLREDKGNLANTNSVKNTNLSPDEVEEIISEMEAFVLPDTQHPNRLVVEDVWIKLKEKIRANGITL